MKRDFDLIMADVKRLHEKLVAMKPVTKGNLGQCNFPGVYLFTESGEHLYVGRTGRHLKKRLPEHWRVKDAPLAFRLARIATGNLEASYKPDDKSRSKLMKDPGFVAAFAAQKKRIAKMSIQYVGVDDATTQALLEIYTSTVLGTPYNEFKTT